MPSAGRSSDGLTGSVLRATLAALQATVAAQTRRLFPEAPSGAIADTQELAAQTWLGLLNASWPEAPAPLTCTQIEDGSLMFSAEFCHLANCYARALTGENEFAQRLSIHLISPMLPLIGSVLPFPRIFQVTAWLLRRNMGAAVRTVRVEAQSASVCWDAAQNILPLPESYHDDYLSFWSDIYTHVFSALPRRARGWQPARITTEHTMLHGDPYFQWRFDWRPTPAPGRWLVWAGLALSILLALLAIVGGPTLGGLAWVVPIPAFGGWFWHRQLALRAIMTEWEADLLEQSQQARARSNELQAVSAALQKANAALQRQVENLTAVRDVTLVMGATLDRRALLDNAVGAITFLLNFDRTIILLVDTERQALVLGASSHPVQSAEDQFRLEQLEIPLAAETDLSLLSTWKTGQTVLVEDGQALYSGRYGWVFGLLNLQTFLSVPLCMGNTLLGVILADNSFTGLPISDEARNLLSALAANIAIALENARLYHMTDEALNRHVAELNMMRQIDRELNDALSLDRVLNLTIDWALRLTGAHASLLAMVEPEARELRVVAAYGFDIPDEKLIGTRLPFDQSIAGRVARSAESVIVQDVKRDPDHIAWSKQTCAHLSVPVRRENRVVAVLSLETRRSSGFTPEHLDFAERLANRAAVAIDNAYLFDVTQREREKLSSILANTTDVIIVVGFDGNLLLINQAAFSVFHLNPRQKYVGRPFGEVFVKTPLEKIHRRMMGSGQRLPFVEEIATADGERFFHTHVAPNEQVGWVLVMHDVTPFKETDRLKNELIATVSHDLKNPLSVINGYIELIAMYNQLNERGIYFMEMVRRAIVNMRQLIDDLLDLAYIDAGLNLKLRSIELKPLIEDSVMELRRLAEEKQMELAIDLTPDLPLVAGDAKRLRQIVVNLVSNAIKYTPPEGHVRVQAEAHEDFVLVMVKDDGMGISPEDQGRIFERFYRVRNAETEGIEGTGLGLAIVKSLVEAHGGQIGLESRLGGGSTFHFTIPRARINLDGQGDGQWSAAR